MKLLTYLLVLFINSPSAWGQADAKPAAEFQAAIHFFDYDAKQPLDVHDKVIEQFNGGTLHDITYTSPKGGPVDAYLVVPDGNGPFAAILFGHWGNGTRAEFIPEAKIYARAGAVSLIPDYPWDRPQPWHKTPDHFDKPGLDREIEIQAVVDLPRGFDLLLAGASRCRSQTPCLCRTQLRRAMGIDSLRRGQAHENLCADGRRGQDG